MAYSITSQPDMGAGDDIRTFVDDISATTHGKREVRDPQTKKICMITVHAGMAVQLAEGIRDLKGKNPPKLP